MLRLVTSLILAGVAVNEGLAARRLWLARKDVYAAAKARASELGRQLLVIGDPDSGAVTRFFPAAGCGDLCVDLTGCPSCPVGAVIDVDKGLAAIQANSAVVFVSCVLEYVRDPAGVAAEALRVAGDAANLFVVVVDPNTVTSYLYPGAHHQLRDGRWVPVDTASKVAVGGVLAAAVVGLAVSLVPETDPTKK